MKEFKKSYKVDVVDILKRRFVSKILHEFIDLYDKQYPNLAVFSRDHVGIRVQVDGLYEKPYLEFFIEWLQFNKFNFSGLALDVGANIGNHSVFFSKYFHKVISFEPNPSTYHLLSYNATLGKNITAYNYGISEIDSDTFMSSMDGNAGGAYVDSNGTIPIKLINLDNFLLSEEKISLIKIDVEGHELTALNGMCKTISENKPLILFEQHLRDFKGSENEVINYLNTLGYKRFVYISDGVMNNGFFNKIKKLFIKERKMIIETSLRPDFYIFIIAIHEDEESKFI